MSIVFVSRVFCTEINRIWAGADNLKISTLNQVSGCILTKFNSTMLLSTNMMLLWHDMQFASFLFNSRHWWHESYSTVICLLANFNITRDKSVSQCCSIRRPERQCTALASEMMRLWNDLSVAVHQLFEFSLPDDQLSDNTVKVDKSDNGVFATASSAAVLIWVSWYFNIMFYYVECLSVPHRWGEGGFVEFVNVKSRPHDVSYDITNLASRKFQMTIYQMWF